MSYFSIVERWEQAKNFNCECPKSMWIFRATGLRTRGERILKERLSILPQSCFQIQRDPNDTSIEQDVPGSLVSACSVRLGVRKCLINGTFIERVMAKCAVGELINFVFPCGLGSMPGRGIDWKQCLEVVSCYCPVFVPSVLPSCSQSRYAFRAPGWLKLSPPSMKAGY